MRGVGIVFASTGGNKLIRAVRSFRRIEPNYPCVHVAVDVSSNSWRQTEIPMQQMEDETGAVIRYIATRAHINGCLNEAMRFMEEEGYSHACLFHDDIVFSPFPEHRGSVSKWFTPELLASSGVTFGHFETSGFDPNEKYARRSPEEWDAEDLESDALWSRLMNFQYDNGFEISNLPNVNFYARYEGPDKVRKWNRLGPTGQVVPIATWRAIGKFDEVAGVHYDQDYTSECFRRKLPPVYAVPNIPWLHLHNQSMRPGGDPAPEPWGSTEAYVRKFGANWPGFWKNDWEERWAD